MLFTLQYIEQHFLVKTKNYNFYYRTIFIYD